MYDFDKLVDRRGTGCVKWDKQYGFGVKDGLLPFWIADTDFAALPEVIEAIKKRLDHPICGYSDVDEGCLAAIQNWYSRRHGWKIPVEAMLMGSGVVTSMRFIIQAVTQPGDKVLVFTPVYDPFFAITENSGRTLVTCPLTPVDNVYQMDFDLLEQELKGGVKLVMLCNPHNPIGRVWSYNEVEQFANLCAKYEAYVVSDEIHGDITYNSHRYTTAGRFPQLHDKLVVMTAISKTFNMAGLISSCMMIPNPTLKKRVDDALSAAWIFGPNALAYSAITAAYTHGDRWVDELNAYLECNARFVTLFCAAHLPLVTVTEQQGTFLMWLDMRALGLGSDELTKLMADKYKLALGNGAHYGIQADGFMRLNIGCPHTTLEQGMNSLSALYTDRLAANL